MAKKKKTTAFDNLQDLGFQQAASQGGMANIPQVESSTPATPTPTPVNQPIDIAVLNALQDYGFQQQIKTYTSALPPAFIPYSTIIDSTGNAVVVDINGRDINGNVVKEATSTQSFEPDAKVIAAADTAAMAADTATASAKALKAETLVDNATPTTSIDVIRAGLKALGFKSNILDSSTRFIQDLLIDGIDYDNAVNILLEMKDYTFKNGRKMESPFYQEYGFLNEYTTMPKDSSELFNFVGGIENIVKKYNLSNKFSTRDALIKYAKNDVEVAALDNRANLARLKALTADPIYVDALKNLGYIRNNEDLTDFYLDPEIGTEKFEDRRRTFYLTTEAMRRASAGINVDTARMERLAAALSSEGLTAEQVGARAAQGYETISQQLPELTKLSGIFERRQGVSPKDIQTELESEQLLGMASERRKRLEQSNINIFSGRSGKAVLKTDITGLV